MNEQQSIELTRRWLEKIVVGLNLCPFAAPVLKADSLRISTCFDSENSQLLAAVLKELDILQCEDESTLATSLLVFPEALSDFDDYLTLAETANELLTEVGLDGVIQIATFHPNYCFDGVAEDDISNYSNRSPLPMLHFIREEQLERVLSSYPNPEQIPKDNIERLRRLGHERLFALLKNVGVSK